MEGEEPWVTELLPSPAIGIVLRWWDSGIGSTTCWPLYFLICLEVILKKKKQLVFNKHKKILVRRSGFVPAWNYILWTLFWIELVYETHTKKNESSIQTVFKRDNRNLWFIVGFQFYFCYWCWSIPMSLISIQDHKTILILDM